MKCQDHANKESRTNVSFTKCQRPARYRVTTGAKMTIDVCGRHVGWWRRYGEMFTASIEPLTNVSPSDTRDVT